MPQSDFTCSIPGCSRKVLARTWCAAHYYRWRTHGDVQAHVPIGLPPLSERFLAQLARQPNGCLFWTGRTNPETGYGMLASLYAHRFAWELHNGPIPDGLYVLHRCDIFYPVGDITYRRCVEPSHLFLGACADNLADMRAKGRWHINNPATGDRHGSRLHPEALLHGEAISTSRLTSDQVILIREARRAGVTSQALGEQYGVSKTSILNIEKRKTWAHIP